MKKLSLILVIAVLLSACSADTLFEKEYKLPETGWTPKDSVFYQFSIEDTTRFYDLVLDVHGREEYKYQNLYVSINTVFPSGSVENDIVSLELGTPGGLWHGKCSSGICRVPVLLQEKFKFPAKGSYEIKIAQYSRMDTVKNLNALTLKVKSHKEE